MNCHQVTPAFFEALFAAKCACSSENCGQRCSESGWLRSAQRFVQSYLPALTEARNAEPNSPAWWSAASERKPVPTWREYYQLMHHTVSVSATAREKMAQYLERELPGFDKSRGGDQAEVCMAQYQYRAMIAENPPPYPNSPSSRTLAAVTP